MRASAIRGGNKTMRFTHNHVTVEDDSDYVTAQPIYARSLLKFRKAAA